MRSAALLDDAQDLLYQCREMEPVDLRRLAPFLEHQPGHRGCLEQAEEEPVEQRRVLLGLILLDVDSNDGASPSFRPLRPSRWESELTDQGGPIWPTSLTLPTSIPISSVLEQNVAVAVRRLQGFFGFFALALGERAVVHPEQVGQAAALGDRAGRNRRSARCKTLR